MQVNLFAVVYGQLSRTGNRCVDHAQFFFVVDGVSTSKTFVATAMLGVSLGLRAPLTAASHARIPARVRSATPLNSFPMCSTSSKSAETQH